MFRIYIGSRNETNQISSTDEELIVGTLSLEFDSFTYHKAVGVFRGTKEETLIVTVGNTTLETVKAVASELRALLEQDGIGIEHEGAYIRVIE